MRRTHFTILSAILLGTALLPGAARGDGGTVRLSQRVGPHQVAVFTSPTPFRQGPVDVSVFVQDAAGRPLTDLPIEIRLKSLDAPGRVLYQKATVEAATNKLFHAALFDLPAPGRWQVDVTVAGSRPPLSFEVVAAAPLPAWTGMSFWIAWPGLAVMLFTVHQILARRRSRGRIADLPPL